ncbi:glycosyltransferase [uncultured Acetatifactor sp.]|nr:glycosyltransferase [uncultured Acetatifactor sp.]
MIHNFHRKGSASGDDQVYKNEAALLEAHGNKVIRYTASNDVFDEAGALKKMIFTVEMLWSFRCYRDVKRLIRKERPDIVHVHTFFPLISPSVLYAAKRAGCSVAATLHDTRFICPCATSLRGMELCNDCGDGHYLRMCRYKCFKGSKIQSLIVAVIFKYHRIRKSFYRQIDKYICLNDSQIDLLRGIGFDREKIEKKYNYVPDKGTEIGLVKRDALPERYAVYYGRIGEEKGIRLLMEMWEKIPDIPLVVMGSGPMEQEFCDWADTKGHVHYLGYVQHEECISIVKAGMFVVFPSVWYEGCSMVEIEAQSLGIPLIATDLGFSTEAIEDGVNGYRIPVGDIDGFVEKIRVLWMSPDLCRKMGRNARQDYEAKYLAEDNYRQLMRIYDDLVRDSCM